MYSIRAKRRMPFVLVAIVTTLALPSSIAQEQGDLQLPVSLNEVMAAMINHAADPIWVAAWKQPESEREWRELERHALQLELAGVLLTAPGTGPLDAAWVNDPRWQKLAVELQDVGAMAVGAVRSRDIGAITTVGDFVVDICERCHRDFKPDVPTRGVFGELSPTEDELD